LDNLGARHIAYPRCFKGTLQDQERGARDGTAQRYLAMLPAGRTRHRFKRLGRLGSDACDLAFWQIELNMTEQIIVELHQDSQRTIDG
jgi:oligoendopeptidase F